MTETKREKFDRLRDMRVPKITHAMLLLQNLAGAGYESDENARRALIAELQVGVDSVAAAFGVATKSDEIVDFGRATAVPTEAEVVIEKPKAPQAGADAQPSDLADGGSPAKHEILWAHDAVLRKDWKLAENRLKRIIDMWT